MLKIFILLIGSKLIFSASMKVSDFNSLALREKRDADNNGVTYSTATEGDMFGLNGGDEVVLTSTSRTLLKNQLSTKPPITVKSVSTVRATLKSGIPTTKAGTTTIKLGITQPTTIRARAENVITTTSSKAGSIFFPTKGKWKHVRLQSVKTMAIKAQLIETNKTLSLV